MTIKHIAIVGAGTGTIGAGIGSSYYFTADWSIKAQLTKERINLIKKDANDDIWSIALTENKEKADFATNASDLKEWCLNSYKESLNNKEKLEKTKLLCSFPPTTIKEKLNKDEKSFTTKWVEKFAKVSEKDKLIDKLKEIDKDLTNLKTDTSKSSKALQGWCEKHKEDKLVPTTYVQTYKELVDLCV